MRDDVGHDEDERQVGEEETGRVLKLWVMGHRGVFEGTQTGGKDEDEVRTAAENKFEQHAMGRKELLTWQRLVCDKGLIRRVLVATSLASPAAIGEAGGASLSVECTAADGYG